MWSVSGLVMFSRSAVTKMILPVVVPDSETAWIAEGQSWEAVTNQWGRMGSAASLLFLLFFKKLYILRLESAFEITKFWCVTPCGFLYRYWRFRGSSSPLSRKKTHFYPEDGNNTSIRNVFACFAVSYFRRQSRTIFCSCCSPRQWLLCTATRWFDFQFPFLV